MNSQQPRINWTAAGLLALSISGTLALFGCVPLLAKRLDPQVDRLSNPNQPQVTSKPIVGQTDTDSFF